MRVVPILSSNFKQQNRNVLNWKLMNHAEECYFCVMWGDKNNFDMFTLSTNISLPESSLLVTPFSALPKLRWSSYKPDWGLGVTSLNHPPTGGEVTALAASDSWSPLLTHHGFPAFGVHSWKKGKPLENCTRRQIKWQISGSSVSLAKVIMDCCVVGSVV